MFCYLWHETTDLNECKFGERWVKSGQDPETEILKRIKESVGVRKDKFRDGTIELIAFWDVSEMAKQVCPDRFKQHGRVDDYIRSFIGFRKGTTGEVHTLAVEDMAFKVNEFLKRNNQPLPEVGLSRNQYNAAESIITAIGNNKTTIVANLCARFGKTIWAGVLVKELDIKLTVVASYVLTSFASFKKDLSSFEQFRNFVLIDAADDGFNDTFTAAMNSNAQVVVFLSMCNGGKRQQKIDTLFSVAASRMLIVDEADYGINKPKQLEPLANARKPNDIVILMTGTNGDKAAGNWPIDYEHCVLYTDLLIEKSISQCL